MARKSDRPIVFVEREASSPIWWLLAGGALGAGLALLFAPESGEHTRLSLARRLRRLRNSAEEVLDEFAEAAGDGDPDPELSSDAEDGELDEDSDETDSEATEAEELGDGQRPEGNARAQLEQRLAAVRARRQRAFADEDEEPVA